MKVYYSFEKEDGSITPMMTAEEVKAGKYTEYGLTEEQYEKIWLAYYETAFRVFMPDTKVTIEGGLESA